MRNAERVPFTEVDPRLGEAGLAPLLPLALQYHGRTVDASGLLDTGATVNVLPYPIGVQLGLDWEEQRIPVSLTGNLSRWEARAVVIHATVGSFPAVRLAFAWTEAVDAPLILGQVNFLMEFDACFYRSRRFFEVRPRKRA